MPASPQQAADTEHRRKQAVALRLGGAPWQAISDQLGYSGPAAACKDVGRALAASAQELRQGADQLRTLQHQRYERLLMAVWPQAVQGDLRANERAERLINRISELHGLNAPIQHEVITVDAVTARIRVLAEQLDVPIPERLALPPGDGPTPVLAGTGDAED